MKCNAFIRHGNIAKSAAAVVVFLAPLALTNCITDIADQFLNIGILHAAVSHSEQIHGGTDTLAAFGLALYIQKLVASPMGGAKSMGLVLGGCHSLQSVCLLGFVCGALLLVLALPWLGDIIFLKLHGRSAQVGREAKFVTACLVPLPLLEGLARFFSGVLLRRKFPKVVAVASMCDIAVQILVVGTFLQLLRSQQMPELRPVLVPLVATYAGVVTRLFVVRVACMRSNHDAKKVVEKEIESASSGDRDIAPGQRMPSFMEIGAFLWPLTVVELGQRSARPLVNLAVSRMPQGEAALAALTVSYPIVHLGYGWLTEMKALPAALCKEPRITSHSVNLVCAGCCSMSLLVMGVVFWTPAQRWLLLHVVGVAGDVAQLCAPMLAILALIPLPVAFRAVFSGWANYHKRTSLLAPSAFARSSSLPVALVVLGFCGLQGAALGAAGLLASFVAESAVVVGMCIWHGLPLEWSADEPRAVCAKVAADPVLAEVVGVSNLEVTINGPEKELEQENLVLQSQCAWIKEEDADVRVHGGDAEQVIQGSENTQLLQTPPL